jgi:TRAP-type mannitol/chloroaromatic compound transport system substrate-binding protein
MKRKVLFLLTSLTVILSIVFTLVAGCGGGEPTSTTPGGTTPGGTTPGGSPSPTSPVSEGEVLEWQFNSYHESANPLIDADYYLAEQVDRLTNGRFKLKIFPTGQLTASTECYNSVRSGAFKIGSGTGETGNPDFAFVTSYCFYMTPPDWINWYFSYGGREIVDELHAEYGTKYFPTDIIACDAGFRSHNPIETIADFKDKKVRAGSAITQQMITDWGGTAMFIAGSEIYEAMQRGIVDMFEFVNPKVDWNLGFNEISEYWVAPAWYQTYTAYGITVNLDAWNELPPDFQAALEAATQMSILYMQGRQELESAEYTRKWYDYGTIVTRVSDEFYAEVEPYAKTALEDYAKQSEWACRILRSHVDFFKEVNIWKALQEPWTYGYILPDEQYAEIPDEWLRPEWVE